jgi:hypothetical protein
MTTVSHSTIGNDPAGSASFETILERLHVNFAHRNGGDAIITAWLLDHRFHVKKPHKANRRSISRYRGWLLEHYNHDTGVFGTSRELAATRNEAPLYQAADPQTVQRVPTSVPEFARSKRLVGEPDSSPGLVEIIEYCFPPRVDRPLGGNDAESQCDESRSGAERQG